MICHTWWTQACLAASKTKALMCINDVTANRKIQKYIELYLLLRFSQMIYKTDRMMFTVPMDNDPKHAVQATQELHKAKELFCFFKD